MPYFQVLIKKFLHGVLLEPLCLVVKRMMTQTDKLPYYAADVVFYCRLVYVLLD